MSPGPNLLLGFAIWTPSGDFRPQTLYFWFPAKFIKVVPPYVSQVYAYVKDNTEGRCKVALLEEI